MSTATLDWQSAKLDPSFVFTPEIDEALIGYWRTREFVDGELCLMLAGPNGMPSVDMFWERVRIIRGGSATIGGFLHSVDRGQRWTEEDYQVLRARYAEGLSLTHLSIALYRSSTTIKLKLRDLRKRGLLTGPELERGSA